MFLLIYAPKIAGKIDLISLVCLFIFAFALRRGMIKNLQKSIVRPTINYLIFGAIMLVYVTFLVGLNGLNDLYQILRFGRIIVNILGLFGLVAIYNNYYKLNYGSLLLYHLWLCIISHAFIMLLMFYIPALNHFVINYLIQLDVGHRSYEVRSLGNRIGGLTNSWDATSGIQALGLLLLPLVLNRFCFTKKRRLLVLATIPLSLFAVGISGVTGLLVFMVLGVLIIIPKLYKRKLIFKYVIRLSIVGFITVFSLNYFSENHRNKFQDSSIGRTLYMVTKNEENYNNSKYSRTAIETVSYIFNKMYFLPKDEITFLFGKGGSGRSKDYVIKADPGFVLNFHNLGVFFVLILYSYFTIIVFKAVKLSRHYLYEGVSISVILLTILIIDSKVMYLLARNSLSIMLIAYFALFSFKKTINRYC